jgi:Peptidase family M23
MPPIATVPVVTTSPGTTGTVGTVGTTSTTSTMSTTSVLAPFDPTGPEPPSLRDPPTGGWPVRPLVFPVLGRVSYADGWGDYRSDIATHFHIGVDILGTKLQPLVAVTSGVISHIVQNHVTAGWGLVITDEQGWDYRYYHLNNDAPGTDDGGNPAQWRFAPGLIEGSRVAAGQLIGYMGDSGDAETTTHTHFEIHQPDGSPINPFPSVRAAQASTRCTPPPRLGELPGAAPPSDTDAEIAYVGAYQGIGVFTLSANGTVFRVGTARDTGDARFAAVDGPCPGLSMQGK